MVQALAQELISLAKKDGAQDIYFIPKDKVYELHMRIGDERRLINSYDFEKLGAVISHFKFRELYTSLHHQQHIVFMRISKKAASKRKSSFNNV